MAVTTSTTTAPKSSSIITVIRKIGEKILSIVEWPVTHAEMLCELLTQVEKDVPETKTVIQQLVARIEGMGPDAISAIAEKGFNIPADVKVGADLQGLFNFVRDTFLPTIETDYAEFKKITSQPPTPLPPPVAEPQGEPISGPGLHTVVAE